MLDEKLLLVMQRKSMVMDEIAREDWQAAAERMAWFTLNKVEVRWNPTKQVVFCWWDGNTVDWVTNEPRSILDLHQLVQHEAKRVPRVKQAATDWAHKQGYVVTAIEVGETTIVVITSCDTPCGAVTVTVSLDGGEWADETPLDVLSNAEAALLTQSRKVQAHHEAEFVQEQAGVELMQQRRRRWDIPSEVAA